MENDLNLNNLPVELFDHIFKYMDLYDIWETRLVSKKFYSGVKSFKIRQLWFMPNEFLLKSNQPLINIWFSTTKSISLGDHLDTSKLGLLLNPSKNLFTLKYLRLEIIPRTFNIECLNEFTKLKILKLNGWTLKSDHSLKLKNLKSLIIHFKESGNGNLEIDAPNLHSLGIDDIFQQKMAENEIKFKTPLSIKHLKVARFNSVLSAFQSLECLEIGTLDNVDLNDNILKFKNLHILRIHDMVKIRENSAILKDTFNSKTENLKIFLSGVKIDKINKIDEYVAEENILRFQLDYYNGLEDNLYFVTFFNYCEFYRLEPFYTAPDMFKKYNNIQSIIINSLIKEESHFLKFIKECKNLKNLEVNKCASLKQQFYDTLPAVSSLSRLSIESGPLNFKFILKMSCLIYLKVWRNNLINEDLNLDSLKYLRKVEIRQLQNLHSSFFHIYKKRNNMYQLTFERIGFGTIYDGPDQTFCQLVLFFNNYLIGNKISNP